MIKKIVLIGAPASGKSTLAKAYAAKHGLTVYDVDEEITRRYGEISALYARVGEREFRNIENESMLDAAKSTAQIVACGGGAVLNKQGVNALRRAGNIVRLSAPREILEQRVRHSARPLKDKLDTLLEEREPLYARYADYAINSVDGDATVALEKVLGKPRANRYDVMLCDADDTVLDYQAAMRHCLTASARAVGIRCSDEHLIAQYKIVSDDIWGRLERGVITHDELNRLRFVLLRDLLNENFDVEKMNDVYFDEMKKTRYLIPGAREFLTAVRARGIKVYVATNAFESIARERLKALDGLIDGAFISEAVGYDKPDVRYFQHLHAAIGSPNKSRMLMFGDGLTSDIAGGKAFGIDTCLFDRSGLKRSDADYTVATYDELSDII